MNGAAREVHSNVLFSGEAVREHDGDFSFLSSICPLSTEDPVGLANSRLLEATSFSSEGG